MFDRFFQYYIFATMRTTAASLFLLIAISTGYSAETISVPTGIVDAVLTYEIADGEVTITDCNDDAFGELIVPDTIEGLPVTKIGANAFSVGFSGSDSLTSISLPSSISSIGPGAFQFRQNLCSINIPPNVAAIEFSTFRACASLKSINLPHGLARIERAAFFQCYNLESVTISSTVTSIDTVRDAFGWCTALERIDVDSQNPTYSSVDGFLYDKNQEILLVCPAAKSGDAVILSGVTTIEANAFNYCQRLVNVILPDSVTEIRSAAFAFSSFESVNIPPALVHLGALSGRTMSSLNIPASVVSIDIQALRTLPSLEAIDVDPSNPNYSSVDGILYDKAQTSLLRYPEAKADAYSIPTGVASIGDYAFSNSDTLTAVSIPASVNSIGAYAFSGCGTITSLTIPANVNNIGYRAFYYTENLEEIIVSSQNVSFSSVEGVLYNKNLTSIIHCPVAITGNVNIPNGVTSIAQAAFSNCTSLTSVSIPSSVSNISMYEFSRIDTLQSINVSSNNASYSSSKGILYNKNQEALLQCPGAKTGTVNIPNGVTRIEYHAFRQCKGVTSINIPSTVTSIYNSAFEDCINLISLDLPPDLLNISNSLFEGCVNLESVSIPAGLNGIWSSAFSGCTSLSSINIPSGLTEIGTSAFRGCSSLETVYIPSSVTQIGGSVFYDCENLRTISVSQQNPAYSSFDGLLYDENRTTLMQCPGGKLGSVDIPSSAVNIHPSAFYNCVNLENIHVDPLNAVYASVDGLLYDKSLRRLLRCPAGRTGNVEISQGTSIIETSAFDYCDLLTTITVPSSVLAIDQYALTYINTNGPSVVFEGDAPIILGFFNTRSSSWGTVVRNSISTDLTYYYYSGSSGFNTPKWSHYDLTVIDRSVFPAAPWLISKNLPYDTNLNQDLNGDGIELLLAYALNLNPVINLADSMPDVTFETNTMSMRFYGIRPGITYQVERSTDLSDWHTDGVNISEPDPDGFLTATIDASTPSGFVRLVVED